MDQTLIIFIIIVICCCCCSSSSGLGGTIYFINSKTDDTDDTVKNTDTKTKTEVNDGTSVKCSSNGFGKLSNTYRSVGDSTLSYYPNAEIAKSWDPVSWSSPKVIDCFGYTKGPDMTLNK